MKIQNSKIYWLALSMLCMVGHAETPVTSLNTEDQKISYMIGLDIADKIVEASKQTGYTPDINIVIQAIRDVQTGNRQLNKDQERKLSEAYQQKIHARLDQMQKEQLERNKLEMKATSEKNNAEGKAYLDANAKKPGVHVTPSGLQYSVLVDGKGRKPNPTDTVTVNYRMSLINGKEIENTNRSGRPELVALASAMPGWKEALPMMNEGSRWLLVIPSNLAYGDKQAGLIGPSSVIICEIELVKASNTSGDH